MKNKEQMKDESFAWNGFNYAAELGGLPPDSHAKGVRAGLNELYKFRVPMSGLDSCQTIHLLRAVNTDGFKVIPASLLASELRIPDLTAKGLLESAAQRIDFLTQSTHFLLDKVEELTRALGAFAAPFEIPTPLEGFTPVIDTVGTLVSIAHAKSSMTETLTAQ
jgi:hypothetical protein